MKLKKLLPVIVISAGLLSVTSAFGAEIGRIGNITRTLSDSTNYGGCMVHIDTTISSGCPENGWVSLDCDGNFHTESAGKRHYMSALTAFALGKAVYLAINTTQKTNGYCTARRLDIL